MPQPTPVSAARPTQTRTRDIVKKDKENQQSQTDADADTGCMEFVIRKGRFSFRLTAPYSDERRQATSELAKKNGLKGRA